MRGTFIGFPTFPAARFARAVFTLRLRLLLAGSVSSSTATSWAAGT